MRTIYCAYDDSKGDKIPHADIKSVKQMKQLNAEGYGIFFSVNQFTTKRRGTHLAKLRFAFIDIDCGKDNELGLDELDKLKAEAVGRVKEKGCTHIQESRNGIHAMWALDGKSMDKDLYQKVLKGLHKEFKDIKADRLLHITQVLRLPGFYHNKGKPFLCKKLYENENVYSLEDLDLMFPYKEKPKYVPKKFDKTSSNASVDAIPIEDIVYVAGAVVGDDLRFDKQHRLVKNGRVTGVHRGKREQGDNQFLSGDGSSEITKSGQHYTGNKTTIVARILDCSTKEAYRWICETFNIN